MPNQATYAPPVENPASPYESSRRGFLFSEPVAAIAGPAVQQMLFAYLAGSNRSSSVCELRADPSLTLTRAIIEGALNPWFIRAETIGRRA